MAKDKETSRELSARRNAFEPLTIAEARRAARWFKRHFRLADWQVRLTIEDGPPAWYADADAETMGACASSPSYQSVRVWVSNARCKAAAESPMATLFHELDHARAVRTGRERSRITQAEEFEHNVLGDLLEKAYRAGVR